MNVTTTRRKKASAQWLKAQNKDRYVREAVRRGFRSRSYFKIEELDRKFKLFKQGHMILDLGAAPGGWSQYAASRVAPKGTVYAIDLLEMKPLDHVHFIQCDMTALESLQSLPSVCAERRIDVVLSDMAPNITGNTSIDSRNFADIYDSIFEACSLTLCDAGKLVFKFFQDAETREVQERFRSVFTSLKVVKPSASRSKSQESYMIGTGYANPMPTRKTGNW